MQNPNVTTNQGMITMLNATNANKSNVTTLGSTIQSKKEADNKVIQEFSLIKLVCFISLFMI